MTNIRYPELNTYIVNIPNVKLFRTPGQIIFCDFSHMP